MTLVLEPDEIGAEPVAWGARRRALLGGGVLAVLVAGWLWAGLHPVVAAGDLLGVRGLRGAPADAWTIGPTGGRLVLAVRNDGRLPVTLSAPRGGPDDVAGVEGFLRLTPDGLPGGRGPARTATLDPGAETTVLLRATLLRRYCGDADTADEVGLTLRTLGLPTTRRLPLPVPVQAAPSPSCR